ncbi:ATP-binding protein [Ramlibacter sp. USB13]|uniref:ATP-binding protein n=1 Tax=Ramlibacter cellulosilyticus TaxID=2764187 RepID=A0A923MR67_9BURK|nr:ATP-binding protein [Ramlibacter cellulosilyticus]MBC5782332.1 ATP-binding protein [Ramlibacter cellulosilyticus]
MNASPPTAGPACLHLFCGKAGAGKSTLAATVAASAGAVLISEDVWLARLYGDQMHTFEVYRRCSLRLRSVVQPLAVDLLRGGRSVVLDFPANTRASRAWLRAVIDEAGAGHVLHFIDSADAVCLERIEKRNVERPEGSHHLTQEQFAYISSFFEPPGEEEGFEVRRYAG